ncbi:superfamily I DNA/RNA helicase [Actinopolyspora biskrensis]|uniref:Superfamily I DNA/RNA helicase n=1 Tax=Actinopolyspora biskrensis TaxID=1470178 RepID=A0A852YZ69_9ACTN|nr:ATP-binding domain-containing protein [Actinopolyspora biskrensis]NYH79300.1 superfamily I DNA/RNA helicase [Actinopolyspora biskrensis]
MSEAGVELTLLDYDSTAFAGGIVVTSAHISKGLEFDAVVVPYADEENYSDEMDRCMLYIACTRAMHELHLTHEGPVSRFLEFTRDHGNRPDVVHTELAEPRDHAADARVG